MAWRYKGRSHVNPSAPEAYGICDRCDMKYNRTALSFQFDFAGPRLMNKRILVCARCMDKPQDQLRPVVIPPDPVPIKNPRPDQYLLIIDGPQNLFDTTTEPMYDTNGNLVNATNAPTPPNIPPYPYVDYYSLSAPFGGPVNQMQIPDE